MAADTAEPLFRERNIPPGAARTTLLTAEIAQEAAAEWTKETTNLSQALLRLWSVHRPETFIRLERIDAIINRLAVAVTDVLNAASSAARAGVELSRKLGAREVRRG